MRERLGFRHEDLDPALNAIAAAIVAAAFDVRKTLGVGLLESIYKECLVEELRLRGLSCETEVRVPVIYKGRTLNKYYVIDVVVEGKIVIEAKAVWEFHPGFVAQALTYLRLSKLPLAFVINFYALPLGDGIKRLANSRPIA